MNKLIPFSAGLLLITCQTQKKKVETSGSSEIKKPNIVYILPTTWVMAIWVFLASNVLAPPISTEWLVKGWFLPNTMQGVPFVLHHALV